jgi:hypothetical protein
MVTVAVGTGSGLDALSSEIGRSLLYDYRYNPAVENLGLSSSGPSDSKVSLGNITTASLIPKDTTDGMKRKTLLDEDDENSSLSCGGATACGGILTCANTCSSTCEDTCDDNCTDTCGSTCRDTCRDTCPLTFADNCASTCGFKCSPMPVPVPVAPVIAVPLAKTYAAPSPAEQNALISYDVMAKYPAYVYYNGISLPWTSFSPQFRGDALLTWIEMADNGWDITALAPQGTWVRELVYVPRVGDLAVSKIYTGNTLNTYYSSAMPGYKYIWLYVDRKGAYTTVFSVGGAAGNTVALYVQ